MSTAESKPITEAAAVHPLDPLSGEEIAQAVSALQATHAAGDGFRFVAVELLEPTKDQLESAGDPSDIDRVAHAVMLDRASGEAYEAIVSLASGEILDWTAVPGVQPAIMLDEFDEVEAACKGDPAFQEALAKRGVTDMDLVCVDPWSAGFYGEADEDRRLMRTLIYVRSEAGGNPYAHPVDNLVAIFDLNAMQVVEMEDHGVVPVPQARAEYAANRTGGTREALKPLAIEQPEGPGFELDGWHLDWEGWSFRIGFTPREGVVLHTVTVTDGEERRSVLHRASLAEMVVPYGDPAPIQARKNAFDAGEYNIGQLANSLTLGCDCLGEIRYLDATVCDSRGRPVVIPNAICIHEEDAGLLWKHTDYRTDEVEVRRARRMVVSFIATVANYEYAFYWMLYQDGTIELQIKLTGIVSTAALQEGYLSRYGQQLNQDGLYAPNHQHLFNIRLDLDVDGKDNAVYEVDTVAEPRGDANSIGNAFYSEERLLGSELDARRDADPTVGRHWKVVNHGRRNIVGEPVGYRLMPASTVPRFADDDAHVSARAGFTSHHLWVTRYDPSERYAAGDYPNQSRGGDGLPAWTERDRSLEDADLVLWHTIGSSHLVRLEDWPVMPVQHVGFKLEPVGFFDRNPTLDVPAPTCSGQPSVGRLP